MVTIVYVDVLHLPLPPLLLVLLLSSLLFSVEELNCLLNLLLLNVLVVNVMVVE